jgi:hypothetical protein
VKLFDGRLILQQSSFERIELNTKSASQVRYKPHSASHRFLNCRMFFCGFWQSQLFELVGLPEDIEKGNEIILQHLDSFLRR